MRFKLYETVLATDQRLPERSFFDEIQDMPFPLPALMEFWTSVLVNKTSMYTSIPRYVFIAQCLGKHKNNFTYISRIFYLHPRFPFLYKLQVIILAKLWRISEEIPAKT
jgi:hypothetical protein